MDESYKSADDQLGQALNRLHEIGEEIASLAASDEERRAELQTEMKAMREDVDKLHAEREDARAKSEAKDMMSWLEDFRAEQSRKPSKANLIGTLDGTPASTENFFKLVADARSRDLRVAQAAQDRLREIGTGYAKSGEPGVAAKATLGTTDAGGGFLIPNNLVAELIEHATNLNPYRQLLNVVSGVRGSAVDQPVEGLTPTRATVVGWGESKSNTDLTTSNYTATLYTLAHILDVSNQLLRHSEGAAENLVRSTLARKMALGEAYYILAGTGTNEPKGILTSLGTTGQFVTTFTAGATQAGSIASAIAIAAGPLADRNRMPDGAIVAPSTFWTMVAQGTDEAGFFFNPAGGPGQINANGVPSFNVFGVRVIPDANMVAAGATDDLIIGEFGSANLFIGEDYRVDVSDEAGDRWDKNLTGFRAEEEIGFNADPFVVSGHFQRILDVLP